MRVGVRAIRPGHDWPERPEGRLVDTDVPGARHSPCSPCRSCRTTSPSDFGGAGGYLEMNVYKPLLIFNIAGSITLLTDGCTNFRRFLVEGTQPNRKKIAEHFERSLMLVTALAPVIGYYKASKIAHHALERDLTLKAAALQLGFVDEATFDRVVDPAKMVKPYVANTAT